MKAIRILIVDDQCLMREALKTLLEMEDDLEVVGVARDGEEACRLVEQEQPDIVLMDVRMPKMGGVEATRRIRAKYPQIRVLILTTFDEDELVVDGLKAGAHTYLLKDLPSQRLVAAIQSAARGEILLQEGIASKLVEMVKAMDREESTEEKPEPPHQGEPLTVREKAVLTLMTEGLSNAEIAERLFISEGTVKNYISGIYSKLGTSDRTQVVLWAINNKII